MLHLLESGLLESAGSQLQTKDEPSYKKALQ